MKTLALATLSNPQKSDPRLSRYGGQALIPEALHPADLCIRSPLTGCQPATRVVDPAEAFGAPRL
jgi:hypothetical protein